jgi:Flp pilus assembly protein TadD
MRSAVPNRLLTATLLSMVLLAPCAMAQDLSAVFTLMQRKDYARAEPMLRQTLAQGENPEARYLLGFLLIETYRYEEAEEQLRLATAARPGQSQWLMVLARSLLEQGKNVAAGEVLEQAIELEPRAAYYHAHAMTALNAGDLEAAEASLRACLALEAQHQDALQRLGGLLMDQGRNDEAIPYLEQARALNPRNLDTLYRLGVAYRYAGRLPEAEALLRSVVMAVPGHVGALHNLARVLIESGKTEEAAAVMEQFRAMSELRDDIDFNAQAVRKNPDNVAGRVHLASLYLRAGRTQEALTELLAARAMAPQEPRIYRAMATAYRRLGDEQNAARAEQFAARLGGG